jgi:penicillin-binding protein 1A
MAPDGAVKAIVGGRDYEQSQFNRATDADRQPGSSFKPFVYLAALLEGYKPNQIVVDGPVSVGNWSPKNYDGKYAGRTTLTTALAKSYNSIPVKLMLDVGRPKIIEAAHSVGIQAELETWAPMVLGTSALTLLDLTTGYATFAGGGKLAEPYTILEMRRPNGDIIYDRAANAPVPQQVVPEETIADLNSMLSAVVKAGTGRRADLGFAPQGGKTGTNQGYRDAWYIGFTAHNVTGVWVGNDDFTPMKEVTGGLIPAPIWKNIMMVAEQGLAPASVAGIPLDETYTQVASLQPPELKPTTDEKSEPQSGDTAPPAQDESVTTVLNDMFNLFEKPEKAKPAVTFEKKKARKRTVVSSRRRIPSKPRRYAEVDTGGEVVVVRERRQTFELPRANIARSDERNFIEKIFGPNKKKRQRKRSKPFFSF